MNKKGCQNNSNKHKIRKSARTNPTSYQTKHAKKGNNNCEKEQFFHTEIFCVVVQN